LALVLPAFLPDATTVTVLDVKLAVKPF
jgi:hypothetical protein